MQDELDATNNWYKDYLGSAAVRQCNVYCAGSKLVIIDCPLCADNGTWSFLPVRGDMEGALYQHLCNWHGNAVDAAEQYHDCGCEEASHTGIWDPEPSSIPLDATSVDLRTGPGDTGDLPLSQDSQLPSPLSGPPPTPVYQRQLKTGGIQQGVTITCYFNICINARSNHLFTLCSCI